MAQVHIDERKWPDHRHWQFDVERLGEDQHGVWLYAAPDTIAQRGEEPSRSVETGFVVVVPDGKWWIAEFYWDHPHYLVYVNIGTPPEWHGDRMTQIDLDLDVVLNLDGSVEVLDEEEFADHQVRFAYPPELVASAREATESATELLVRGVEPFGSVGAGWVEASPRFRAR